MVNISESVPSKEHQRLVGLLIKWIIDNGYEIQCASYGTYSQCKALDGEFIPDVEGFRRDIELRCFGESETTKTIDTKNTRNQFRKFAHREMNIGKSKGKQCPFYITIPAGAEETLKTVLKELSLDNAPNLAWRSYQLND